MAQILGTAFAAVSFSAANLLFKYIDPEDYSKESKRHDLAMEEMTKARDAWMKENVRTQQRIKELELEKAKANKDFNITNKSLEILKKINQKINIEKQKLQKEPELRDFYKPSEKMQSFDHLAAAGVGFTGAYLATKALDFVF